MKPIIIILVLNLNNKCIWLIELTCIGPPFDTVWAPDSHNLGYDQCVFDFKIIKMCLCLYLHTVRYTWQTFVSANLRRQDVIDWSATELTSFYVRGMHRWLNVDKHLQNTFTPLLWRPSVSRSLSLSPP